MIGSELRPLAEVPEMELVQMAQNRDETAFEELMRRNASTSFRLALSVLKDRQEAEDQVQNSFFNAWNEASFAALVSWARLMVDKSVTAISVIISRNMATSP